MKLDPSMPWEVCSDRITYTKDPIGSFDIYPQLAEAHLKIMHYSGNSDNVCSTIGTRTWIQRYGWEVLREWAPYYVRNKQVGGFVEERDGIIFATVQGVGHMVPQWAHDTAYYLFERYLSGKPISNVLDFKETKIVSE